MNQHVLTSILAIINHYEPNSEHFSTPFHDDHSIRPPSDHTLLRLARSCHSTAATGAKSSLQTRPLRGAPGAPGAPGGSAAPNKRLLNWEKNNGNLVNPAPSHDLNKHHQQVVNASYVCPEHYTFPAPYLKQILGWEKWDAV